MKKLFTSVMAALCLAAPVGTLSAQQTQLTEAQKEAFKKEVLPVVFEQIKEQAGIDILGWANPQISANSISGIPGLESSNLLRAASTTQNISVKPDSILISLGALSPDLAMLGNAKVTFEGYDKKDISVGDLSLSIEMPSTINVEAIGMSVATVNIETEVGQTYGLPFSMDVNMTSAMFGLPTSTDIVNASLTLDLTSGMLEANVDIESGLQTLLDSPILSGIQIPDNVVAGLNVDYLVQVNVGGLLASATTGAIAQVPASLYAVANRNIKMGDAVLTWNPQNQLMPVQKIDVTGYDNGVANKLSLFELDATQTTNSTSKVTRIVVDKSDITPVDATQVEKDTVIVERTLIDMTDNTVAIPSTAQAAVQGVVNRVVSELTSEGEATWYEMNIQRIDTTSTNILGTDTIQVVNITVSPNTTGADIDVNLNDSTTYTVRAVIEEDAVAASVILNDETTYGTAYFTYNLSQGTPDATEEISASAIRIIPTDNGVRVLNAERADYQIVSMTGSTVARGVVSGDETISTANLPKGIYVIAVDQNGDREVVKFVR